MDSPDYHSEKETRYCLSFGYNSTFYLLKRPENQHRFTEKEQASFDYIKDNHRIETAKPFSVGVWEIGKPNSL